MRLPEYLQRLEISQDYPYDIPNNNAEIIKRLTNFMSLYKDDYRDKMEKIKNTYDSSSTLTTYGVYAETCLRNKDYANANAYNEKAMAINEAYKFNDRWGIPYISKGMILQNQNKHYDAIEYFKKSIPHSIYRNVLKDQLEAEVAIAESYFAIQNYDSALVYCNSVVEKGKIITFNEGLQKSYHMMYQIYKIKSYLNHLVYSIYLSFALIP